MGKILSGTLGVGMTQTEGEEIAYSAQRTATFAIAASTSSQADIDAADYYVSDYSGDLGATMNAAIDALPTITGGNNRPGGKIGLCAGDYTSATAANFSNSTSIKDILLAGAGIDNTFIKLGYNGTIFTSSRTDLEIGSGGIRDMTIDGQWHVYKGIGFKGCPYHFTFEKVEMQGFRGDGSSDGICIWLGPGTGSPGGDRVTKILECLLQESVKCIHLDGTVAGFNGTLIQNTGINGRVGVYNHGCLLTSIVGCGIGTPATNLGVNMIGIEVNGNSEGLKIDGNHIDVYAATRTGTVAAGTACDTQDATGVVLEWACGVTGFAVNCLTGLTLTNTTQSETGTITSNTWDTITCSGGLSGAGTWEVDDEWSVTGSIYNHIGITPAGGETCKNTLIHNNHFWGNTSYVCGLAIRVDGSSGTAELTTITNNHIQTDTAMSVFLHYNTANGLVYRDNDMGDTPPTDFWTAAGTNTDLHLGRSDPFPFVTGTSGTTTGWDVDAAGETATAFCAVPTEAQRVHAIILRGRGITTDGTNEMLVDIDIEGGAEDEAYNAESYSADDIASDTVPSANDDIVQWTVTDSGVCGAGGLKPGDTFRVTATGAPTDGTDLATDCHFQSVEVQYS